MAKLSFGSISVFNHEVQEWYLFKDRLEQWFLANELEDSEDKSKRKRRAILLSSLSENTYKLVRDLALPTDVGTLNYEDVVKLLDEHCTPATCGFAERFKFHSATQHMNEGLAEWAARVRGLAAHCNFLSTALDEALRDRFVLGMQPGPERDRLFTQPMAGLTLSEALKLAEGIRCARQGASQAVPGAGAFGAAQGQAAAAPVLKMAAAAPRREDTCPACGYSGHNTGTCKFTKYKCKSCGVKGHLRRVCPKRGIKHNFIECGENDVDDSDDGKRLIFHIKSARGEPMLESVLVNGITLPFEIDTGAAVTVISEETYNKYFSKTRLKLSNTILKSYNGSTIATLGVITLPYHSRIEIKQ